MVLNGMHFHEKKIYIINNNEILKLIIKSIFIFSEVKEECGLDVISMDKIGILEFEFDGSKELLEVHLYVCKQFSGDIIESEG